MENRTWDCHGCHDTHCSCEPVPTPTTEVVKGFKVDNVGVHLTHCCYAHGCKYGDGADCPVESGKIMGLYKCESCLDEEEDPRHQEIKRLKEENAALKAKIKSLEEGHELCSQYECDHYKMDHNEDGC